MLILFLSFFFGGGALKCVTYWQWLSKYYNGKHTLHIPWEGLALIVCDTQELNTERAWEKWERKSSVFLLFLWVWFHDNAFLFLNISLCHVNKYSITYLDDQDVIVTTVPSVVNAFCFYHFVNPSFPWYFYKFYIGVQTQQEPLEGGDCQLCGIPPRAIGRLRTVFQHVVASPSNSTTLPPSQDQRPFSKVSRRALSLVQYCLVYTGTLAFLLEAHGVSSHFFADDTQLYIRVEDIDEAKHRLSSLMSDLKSWMARRKLKLNYGKTEITVIRGNLRILCL